MPRANFIQEIQRTIEDQIRARGTGVRLESTTSRQEEHVSAVKESSVVSGAAGQGAAPVLGTLTSMKAQQNEWFVLRVDADKLPSLTDFMALHTEQRQGVEVISSQDYYSDFKTQDTNAAYLFVTRISNTSTGQVPITVTAIGARIAVYRGEAKAFEGTSVVKGTVAALPGDMILVIVYGASSVRLFLPDVHTIAYEPVPESPIWSLEPTMEYFSAGVGSLVIRMSWLNDAFASAWQVYRSIGLRLGVPEVVTLNSDFTVTLSFLADLDVASGQEAFLETFYAGRILRVDKFEDSEGVIVQTDIVIIVDEDAPSDMSAWQDLEYVKPVGYASIARLTDGGTPIITFDDLNVQSGVLYIYRVTGFGFVYGNTESAYSDPKLTSAVDTTPPGPIVVGTSQVLQNVVFVRFTAPSDLDFSGVNIYGPYASLPASFEANKRILTSYSAPGAVDQLNFLTNGDGKYYFVSFDSLNNEQEPGDAIEYAFTSTAANYQLAPSLAVDVTETFDDSIVFEWDADGDSLSIVATNVFLEYLSGSSSSLTGEANAFRPDPRQPAGYVVLQALKNFTTTTSILTLVPALKFYGVSRLTGAGTVAAAGGWVPNVEASMSANGQLVVVGGRIVYGEGPDAGIQGVGSIVTTLGGYAVMDVVADEES